MAETTNELLKATARSFYLTLRILPRPVRHQIGLAYLLARTTDTVADTEIVPLDQRLDALKRLRERILGQSQAPLSLGELAQHQGVPAERTLLERVEEGLAGLQKISGPDRKLIQEVLDIITSGQQQDLQRFAGAGTGRIFALETAADLDDYTYRVAGCVGEFWTKLCRAHLFPHYPLDEQKLIADGIRFGKGLQLVNILRDLPADLKNGRCYLPKEKLTAAQLAPETMLKPENADFFLPLFRSCLDQAEAHLGAGWRYTNTLPYAQFRVRLACAWPVLLGLKTIARLRAADVSGLTRRVKVPRGEVYGMILWSVAACPIPFLWRKMCVPGAKAVASGSNLA